MAGGGIRSEAGRGECLGAAAVLRERGRVAWAVGAAVETACGREPVPDLVAALEAIVAQAVSGVEGGGVRAQGRGGGIGPRSAVSVAGGEAEAVWRQLQEADLAEAALPAAWIASDGAGQQRATVVLGLEATGSKRVLGVWAGGAGEHRCSQRLAEELYGRGLGRQGAWLAVTEGERALEMALRQHWGAQVEVAHCQQRITLAVGAHLPASLRTAAGQALAAAWGCSDASLARRELQALAEAWRQDHPGAAARLLAEREASTVGQALGLRGPLLQRLATAAPARYLLQQCRPAGRGHSGREWTAALAMAAAQRQRAFRRLPEHAAVASLMRALTTREAPAASA